MLLFPVFLLAYGLSQFYRSFLAVIAPRLAAELSLTAGDLANMSAAFFLVFAVAQFPLGVALDRIGPRRTVPALMLAAVAGTGTLAAARGPVACILANALIGLGCSPIYMGALYHIGRTTSPHRFGYLTALLLGLGSMGNLLAATPLSLAAEHLGWRATFLGIGALTLGSAVIFWLLVRDPPLAAPPRERTSALSELGTIVALPGLWTLMPIMLLGYATVVVERGLWVGPYFARVHGLEPVPLGNAVLAMAAAMSLGALAFGFLDRTLARRKLLVVIGSLATAAAFLVLAAGIASTVTAAGVAMVTIGFMGLHQPLVFAHARTFFPEHLLGRGMTFANFLTIGGAGLVQWASGVLITHWQARGLPVSEVFARLHMTFAVVIALATLVYLMSPTPAPPRR